MGRKNKLKLQKHGSHSLNSSAFGDADGRQSHNEHRDREPELQVFTTRMRELVTASNAAGTSDRTREYGFVFAELEKKNQELDVAKRLITKLRAQIGEHNGDGDSLAVPSADYPEDGVFELNSELNHVKMPSESQNEVLEKDGDSVVLPPADYPDDFVPGKDDVVIELNSELARAKMQAKTENEVLEKKLQKAHQDIERLKGEISVLENNLETTNSALGEGEQKSDEIIRALKSDLEEANAKIGTLEYDLESRKSTYNQIRSDLESETQCRKSQQIELRQAIYARDSAQKELDEALIVSAKAAKEIISLSKDLQKEKDNNTEKEIAFKQELVVKVNKLTEALSNTNEELNLEKEKRIQQEKLFEQERLEKNEQLKAAVARNSTFEDEILALRADFETEKQNLLRQEEELRKEMAAMTEKLEKAQEESRKFNLQEVESIEQKLQTALENAEKSEKLISVLTAEIEAEKQKSSNLEKRASADHEKLESRYEIINNGVQLIKKDFAAVKVGLVKAEQRNKDLQRTLTASKADVKHYRDDGEACRKCIKRLEGQLQKSIDSNKKTVSEFNDKSLTMQLQLKKAQHDLYNYEKFQKILEKEFGINSGDIMDIILKMREIFLREEKRDMVQRAIIEAKEVYYQDLLKEHEQLKTEMETLKVEFGKTSETYNSDLTAAKNLTKKIRKEKDGMFKKWKRLLDESNGQREALITEKKALEEKLNESMNSSSNDSLTEAQAEIEESIKALKESKEKLEENVSQLSKQLVEKEDENLDLHRTIVAFNTKVEQYDQETAAKQKFVATLESRIVELQRSSEGLQKRYDEDISEIRQKLETAESSLEVQQEMNASINASSEESRQKHDAETSELKSEIQQLKEWISAVEAENLKISDLESKNSSLQLQFEEAQKTIKELNSCVEEIAELKNAVKAAEEEKKATSDLLEAKKSHDAELAEAKKSFERELEESHALRTQIMKQDEEIEKLSANQTINDQALEDMAKLVEQKQLDHEKELQSITAKLEIAGKKLEEKTSESSSREQRLKEKEDQLEEMKVGHERSLLEMKDKIQSMENEMAKIASEKKVIDSELECVKTVVSEKESAIEKLSQEKTSLEQTHENFEKEIEVVNKKLEDALSPKKDKVLQLENRLEVIQTAAKAQQKRLEEELALTREALQSSKNKNQELELQASERQQRLLAVEELTATNARISEELAKALEMKETIADLEQKLKDVQAENAEDRAGLVNELIDAKQKLVEAEKEQQENQSSVSTEPAAEVVESRNAINDMFPSMDPAVRQLVILLSENRNYSYGVLGLVIYGFLVHLYILLW